jgi:hypothetical protein
MFCPNCGNQVAEGVSQCPGCKYIVNASIASRTGGGAFSGFLLLVGSFFYMPVKTLTITLQQLKALGAKGKIDVNETDLPHLTWLGMAGNFLASVAITLIIAVGVVKGLMSIGDFRYSASDAVLKVIGYPILGVFVAIFTDWVIMIWIELLSSLMYISNNVKKLADRE